MKCLVISDTHQQHLKINLENYKDIDTIIHCGDFTNSIRNNEIESCLFLEWYNDLPIKNKILIAGNHDLFFEELSNKNELKSFLKQFYPDIIYLENESIIIDNIKFYGTPWTPLFFDWAFMKEDLELYEEFSKIEKDTDILITHTPAFKILDKTDELDNVGSYALKSNLIKLPFLKYHLFGHIHEDRGELKTDKYIAINASNYYNLTDLYTFEINNGD